MPADDTATGSTADLRAQASCSRLQRRFEVAVRIIPINSTREAREAMPVNPLSGSSPHDPAHDPGATPKPSANSTSGPRAMPEFNGPPGLPVSRGEREGPPRVSANGAQTLQWSSDTMKAGIVKTLLNVVADSCDIQALRADGYPLAYSTEALAGALVSGDVKHVVIAGAFANSRGTGLAVGSIYLLGQHLEHYGKRVTYCAPSEAVNFIALETLSSAGFEKAAKSAYRDLEVERTPDGPSADSEVLARLQGELSPSALIVSIEDKQR